MEATLYKAMPMDDYHAAKKHLSKSMLSDFADCPARFKHYHIDGGKRAETPSLALGKAVHTLALEPEKWKAEYVVLDVDKRTTKGKEEWADAEESGKTILRAKDMEQIEGMANALSTQPFALALLKAEGYVEASIFWQQDGLDFRCRPDFMRNDGLIVDLKTCRSAKPNMFFKDAYNYHYDMSVALTCRGYEALRGTPADNYVFLCIETEAPYIVECYESMSPMDSSGLSYHEIGNMRLDKLLEQYKQCVAANDWPAYSGKIATMKAPAWAINSMILGE